MFSFHKGGYVNEYLLSHTNFALWALYYLLGGVALSIAWGFCFRRLARTSTSSADLVWEARRGLTGGVIWLVALGLIFLLMFTTAEISGAEAIAVSDTVSDVFLQSLAHERDIIVAPAILTLTTAGLVVLLTGIWSGAWRILCGGAAHSATGAHHA